MIDLMAIILFMIHSNEISLNVLKTEQSYCKREWWQDTNKKTFQYVDEKARPKF